MSASSRSPSHPLGRWLGLLAFVTLAVLATLWFLGGTGLQGTTPEPSKPPPEDAATRIERGHYLARIGNCAFCHTARGGAEYAGGRAIATPFGSVLSSNITPDPVYGIGRWTADDFWRALHHGVSADGHPLYPAFPYTSYTRVSRADADALFAYLQSVPVATTPNQAHALRWPYSSELALRVWRALYFKPAAPVADAPSADTAPAERGAYLVDGLGHCMECHSARNALGARSSRPTGNVLPGSRWYAPSLGDAAGASVAAWSPDEVVALLKTGISARGNASGPMAEVVQHGTQYLQEADARAMAAHLRALPQTPVATAQKADASALPQAGAALYEQHCAECHGLQGEGHAGAYPALAGNRAVLQGQTNNLILTVLQGGFSASTAGNPRPYGMPPFKLALGDADMAALLTYVRGAWGNQASAVSEFDINKLR